MSCFVQGTPEKRTRAAAASLAFRKTAAGAPGWPGECEAGDRQLLGCVSGRAAAGVDRGPCCVHSSGRPCHARRIWCQAKAAPLSQQGRRPGSSLQLSGFSVEKQTCAHTRAGAPGARAGVCGGGGRRGLGARVQIRRRRHRRQLGWGLIRVVQQAEIAAAQWWHMWGACAAGWESDGLPFKGSVCSLQAPAGPTHEILCATYHSRPPALPAATRLGRARPCRPSDPKRVCLGPRARGGQVATRLPRAAAGDKICSCIPHKLALRARAFMQLRCRCGATGLSK